MNSIYKVIWSKAKNCYVVASEIARSHTKSASGSEKIGGGTRRKLLASLMALSLLCGGLGVASAVDEVSVEPSTSSSAVEVYTKEKVNTLLEGKANNATTLEGYGITDAYTKNEVYNKNEVYSAEEVAAKLNTKADQTALNDQQTAIDKLEDKTTEISYAAGEGTKISGVTITNGNIVGNGNSAITGLTNVETGSIKTDSINGKSLTGTTVATAKEVEVAVKAETDARTAADTALEEKITKNTQDIAALDGKVTTAQGDIQTNANNIQTNSNAIADTNKRTGGITRNLEGNQTTIEESVKVDKQGNVKDVNELSAKKITTTEDADLKGNVSLGTNTANTVTVNGIADFNEAVNMDKGLTVTNGETNLKDTTVDGDLKVTGTITTDKMIFGDKATNNYTEIDHGKVTSKNLVVDGAGQTISSSSTFNAEEHKVGFANSATGDQSFHKQTSDIIMDNVKDQHNFNNRTQTKTETKDIITDEKGNSSTTSQTASENKTYLKDKDGKNTNSTIDTAKGYDKTIKGENGETSTKQDELNITNTAQNGTITNDAKDIVNNASGNMTNTVGGKLTTTVTEQATENFNGGLNTTVAGAENHTVTGRQTNIVGDGQINNITGGQENNILTGDQKTTVSNGSIINKAENGDISNTAKNVTNEGTESVTNKVGANEVKVSQDGVDINVGADTSRTMTDGRIIDKAGDMTVTTDKTTGTTFGNGTPNDTTVINGGTIGTNKVNANETNTKKLTAGADDGAVGGRLTVDATDGVKGSYKSGNYTSRSYILADTLKSGVDNGKDPIDDDFVGSRTDHYMDGDKAKLDETVKDVAGSNVTNKTSTGTVTTIKAGDKENTVTSTADGTIFSNSGAAAPVTGASGDGTAVNTTIKGNTITTGKVTMDYAEVMKDLGVHGNATVDKDMTVKGNTTLGEAGKETTLTVNSKATFNNGLTVTNGETKLKNTTIEGTLNVFENATFQKDVTANSFSVNGKTYIDSDGLNANNQVIRNVADGSISEGSKDAVNGGQLYGVKRDLEHQVDKVGANAAAMANLRPMEFDPSSKWNIAAAIGNYGSETAAALGAFYRPNDNVMVNLSTAFGTGENMVGGGVSVRLGKGGNKLSREETNALKAQVADLTARMDALLSVLNPNMSKDFPDVPENHWAYEAVSRLAGNDIVQGYPDGEFHGERTMTRYEMAEIIYNALSRGAEAERELVEEFKPELQAMAASKKSTAEKAEG